MTNNWPQLSALTATTARRSYTLSYFDRPSSAPVILYAHLQVLEKANPRAYYDYYFQIVEYSDRGNLPDRFLNLPAPKCFLYGSQNRHLSYLQRLRESECAVVEIPNANHFLFYHQPNHCASALASLAQNSSSFPNPGNANLPIGVFNIRPRRNLK